MKKTAFPTYFLVKAGSEEHVALAPTPNEALALVAKDFLTVTPAGADDLERVLTSGKSILRAPVPAKRGPKPKTPQIDQLNPEAA